MLDELLARIFINQWVVLLVVGFLLLLLAETGYRLGLAARRKNADAAASHSGSVQGAVLGLLGLLLGFSFAMAVARYDARRALVLDEANSIGTTWLRADFLPAAHRHEVRKLLLEYTHLRIDGFGVVPRSDEMKQLRKQVGELHNNLWVQANASIKEQPSPATVSFVTSLNETIDLDSSRMAALRNHVPGAVWLLLLVVSGSSAWASGYSSGVNGMRSIFNQFVFPVLIAIVITLIADIDRPAKGLVGVSQTPLTDLLETIQPTAP